MKFTNHLTSPVNIPALDITVEPGGEFEATGDDAASFEAQGFPRAKGKTDPKP